MLHGLDFLDIERFTQGLGYRYITKYRYWDITDSQDFIGIKVFTQGYGWVK